MPRTNGNHEHTAVMFTTANGTRGTGDNALLRTSCHRRAPRSSTPEDTSKAPTRPGTIRKGRGALNGPNRALAKRGRKAVGAGTHAGQRTIRERKAEASDTRETPHRITATNVPAGAWHHQTRARAKEWQSIHMLQRTNDPSNTARAGMLESVREVTMREQAPTSTGMQATAITSAGPPAVARPTTLEAGDTNAVTSTEHNSARTTCTTITQRGSFNVSLRPHQRGNAQNPGTTRSDTAAANPRVVSKTASLGRP